MVLEKRVRLTLLEDYLVLLLCLGCPELRWMFSDPDLLQRMWIFNFSWALTLPLHWAFWRGFQSRPSALILQCLRLVCLLSRFSPRVTRIQGIFLARLLDQIDVISIGLFAEVEWHSTIAPNGITGPLNGIPEPPLIWCLPIRQEILNVSQIAVTFHGIRPLFSLPDLIATIQQTYLPWLCALLSQQSHLFPICVALTYNDSRIVLHRTCQNSKELSV